MKACSSAKNKYDVPTWDCKQAIRFDNNFTGKGFILTAIRFGVRCKYYTIDYKCVIFTQRKKIFFTKFSRFLKKLFQRLFKTGP